jgi:hypothetical protein
VSKLATALIVVLLPEPTGEDVPGILPQAPTYHCQLDPVAIFPPTTVKVAFLPQQS